METTGTYKPIKVSRGWYFVEYYPPRANYKFATLNLVIIDDKKVLDVIKVMEKELAYWLKEYPVPLFVSAFNNIGEPYNLSEIKPYNNLIGYIDRNNELCLFWGLLKDHEMPDVVSDREYIKSLYSHFEFISDNELKRQRRTRRQQIKIGWVIFFFWLVVIPAIIAILDFSSYWVSLIALVYSLYKAVKKGLELIGKWPKSKNEQKKDLENQMKDHYYYHCEMNPEGFRKLKQENFKILTKAEIINEMDTLNSDLRYEKTKNDRGKSNQ